MGEMPGDHAAGYMPLGQIRDSARQGMGSEEFFRKLAEARAWIVNQDPDDVPEVKAIGPGSETRTRAQREQAAHDAVEDAEAELASSVGYLRTRALGLAAATCGASGAMLVWITIGWWAAIVPGVVSAVFVFVCMVGLFEPPGWCDRRADARSLRHAERALRDILTETEEL